MLARLACYGFRQRPERPAEGAIEGVQRRDDGDHGYDLDVAVLAERAIGEVPNPFLGDTPGVGGEAVDRLHGFCRQRAETVMGAFDRIG